jgi:MATE family multidrug resistance protein
VAALFQIFDGAQAIGAGALRGLKDTRWPMAFAGVGYWIVGLGSAAGLAFGLGLGGLGIWIGLAVGLAATAVLMVVRFFALARPLAVSGKSFATAPVA